MSQSGPSTFAQTIAAEREVINERRRLCKIKTSDGKDLTALCLSGGGIRSAAFCLGVMKALAAAGKLKKFDYLSTVSGGGFAGAFISRWVHEKGYAEVESKLSDAQSFSDPASPLLHLRKYISYLTPRIGIFSLDSLAGIGLYIRNLTINWIIFVPFFIAAILLVLMMKETYRMSAVPEYSIRDWSPAIIAALSIVLVGWSFALSLKHRPGGWASQDPPSFHRLFLELGLPMFAASLLLSFVAVLADFEFTRPLGEFGIVTHPLIVAAIVGAGITLLAYLQAISQRVQHFNKGSAQEPTEGLLLKGGLSFVAQGIFLAVTPALLARQANSIAKSDAKLGADLLTIFSPLVFIGTIFVSEFIYIILRNKARTGELEREWLARSTGAQFRLPTLWALFAAAVLIGPDLIGSMELFKIFGITFDAPTTLTGLAGIVTLWLARAKSTFAVIKQNYGDWKLVGIRRILSIATPIFILGVTALASKGVQALIAAIETAEPDLHGRWLSIGILLLLPLITIGLLADSWININLFSLHGIYRNRIIRTFLGASNFNRTTGFLDFDENDNVRMIDLTECNQAPSQPRKKTIPIPPQLLVVNMAMNVLASPDLTLQERKAIPFTATSVAIGSNALRQRDPTKPDQPERTRPSGCYRDAEEYSSEDGRSITLGTVLAISGAAFNSNMGYHSSPMLSVLLTLFNLRLGAWLGNPGSAGNDTYKTDGPRTALMSLLNEALSRTSEDSKYVQLSDGGHFDNLGLYEMLARKCRLIVVIDAGTDPLTELGDLGIAHRIALLDQGTSISFAPKVLKDFKEKSTRIATGVIDYGPGIAKGKLIYIKPALQGSEPVSVFSYKKANVDFPNESTADQWFNESQFNAYLQLGEHIGSAIPKKDIAFPDMAKRPR